jgi:hypothetical protein
MPNDTTTEASRAHLAAARVGHEAARAYRRFLGGTAPPTQILDPWTRLPADIRRRKAEALAEHLRLGADRPAAFAGKLPFRRVELTVGALAFAELEAHPHADRPL